MCGPTQGILYIGGRTDVVSSYYIVSPIKTNVICVAPKKKILHWFKNQYKHFRLSTSTTSTSILGLI